MLSNDIYKKIKNLDQKTMLYEDLDQKIRNIGKKINAPDNIYPDMRRPRYNGYFAYPHIEIKPPYYHYVVIERGEELQRKKFHDVNDLLFEVFYKITFDMAKQYELYNRVEGQDFRKILFTHQLNLMKCLDSTWHDKAKNEIDIILEKNPYNDNQASSKQTDTQRS